MAGRGGLWLIQGMPLFEYRCENCGKQFTFLTGVLSGSVEPKCPRCDSAQLKKLMSRFVRGRSDDARMDALAERLENSDFEDEGVARRFAREMGREMGAESGEDLSDEIEELIELEARGEDGAEGAEDGGQNSSTGGWSGGSGDDGTIY